MNTLQHNEKIFSFFEFSERNKTELNYLISLIQKLDIVEFVKLQIISGQFKFIKGERVETFPIFYKRIIIESVIYALTNKFIKDYKNDDFELIFGYQVLWEKEDSNLIKFFLKNDLSELTANEIYGIFKEILYFEIKNNFEGNNI